MSSPPPSSCRLSKCFSLEILVGALSCRLTRGSVLSPLAHLSAHTHPGGPTRPPQRSSSALCWSLHVDLPPQPPASHAVQLYSQSSVSEIHAPNDYRVSLAGAASSGFQFSPWCFDLQTKAPAHAASPPPLPPAVQTPSGHYHRFLPFPQAHSFLLPIYSLTSSQSDLLRNFI